MRTVQTIENADGSTTYKVRFRHPTQLSPRTGKPVQTSEVFTKRPDAERFAKWLDALGPVEALERLYAAAAPSDVPTLDTVAADHIRLLTGIEEGTRVGYTRLWSRTWGPALGHLRADQVTADDVRDAVNELSRSYAKKSLENQRGLLSGVLTRCIEKGYITRNPAKGIRLLEGRRVAVDAEHDEDDTEMVCLSLVEWEAVYDAVGTAYRAFVRFLVGTGCRWGEAVVLRVKDVDLGARTVKVRRALKWSPDGNRVIGPPKTKKGRRTIVAPPEVIDDLRPLLEGKAGSDLVFEQVRGGMIEHRNFWSRYWKPAIWRAQLCDTHRAEWAAKGCKCGTTTPARCTLHRQPDPIPCGCPGTLTQAPRIHDLRHTHASWLLANGTPIHVVQARLGHESIQTTVDTYSHLLPDAQLLAAEAASMAFAGQVGGRAWLARIDAMGDDELRQLAAAVQAEAEQRGVDLPLAIEAGTAA